MKIATILALSLTMVIRAVTASAGEVEPAYDDPVPYVIDKRPPPRTRARVLGIGWTLGGGFIVGDRMFPELKAPTYDIGAEIRLFPADRFSFNFNFDIGEMVGESVMIPDTTALHFRTYFNIHDVDKVGAYFSAAPYVGFRAYTSEDKTLGSFDFGGRIGGEVPAPDGTFAMGMYGRPGLRFFEDHLGHHKQAVEVILEITWTGYVLEPGEDEEKAE